MLGNDIVDLHVTEPPLHLRYISRAFTPFEQAAIRGNSMLLWLHWAAKEAAYKALKRFLPHLPFVPRRFEFNEGTRVVSAEGELLAAECSITEEYVHVTCTRAQAKRETSVLIHRLNEHEAMRPSEVARRFLIEEFSRLLGVPSSRLAIVSSGGSSAPCLHIDGSPSNYLLSMSHHGKFAACCFAEQNN